MRQYQELDRHIVDYQGYQLEGVAPHPGGGWFRGPATVIGQPYIACVGAAQTFGRFVPEPYPALLAKAIGMQSMNLGAGGANATYFTSNRQLMRHINAADLVVVQVMSARSETNSQFSVPNHNSWGWRVSDGEHLSADEFFRELLRDDPEALPGIVEENRESWVRSMRALLMALKPPTILLWFSTRTPQYLPSYEDHRRIFGEFPQLVNQQMLEAIRPGASAYVECVTTTGLPHALIDGEGRRTEALYRVSPTSILRQSVNAYYPSPQMHREVAEALTPVARTLLNARGVRGLDDASERTGLVDAVPRPRPVPASRCRPVPRNTAPPHRPLTGPGRDAKVEPAAAPGYAQMAYLVEQAAARRPFRRKFDVHWHGASEHHRSGWPYALTNLMQLHHSEGVLLDTFLERKFSWGWEPGERYNCPRPYAVPWVGFLHNPPNIPSWFNVNQQAADSLIENENFQASLPLCQGIFTLSEALADWLRTKLSVPVAAVAHPTGPPTRFWSYEAYRSSAPRRLIQVGWWLRRFRSLYELRPATNLTKTLLQIDTRWAHSAWEADLARTYARNTFGAVEVMPYVDARRYDALLAESIVFLDLYASSANNAIIECIVRGTPLLVNALPSVVEYLGDDYPLYFEDLDEAARKVEDVDLIVAANRYLMDAPIRTRLTGAHFVRSVVDSPIYQNLA